MNERESRSPAKSRRPSLLTMPADACSPMAPPTSSSRSQRTTLTVTHMVQIASALAEPRRVAILKQLSAYQEPMPYHLLHAVHPVSMATLSHHTKKLKGAGLIDVIRRGRHAKFVLRRDVLRAYLEELSTI